MSERIYEKTNSGKIIPKEEIVRCRECLRWDRERAKNSHVQFKGYCAMFNGFCDGDKYCAWGERKDNDS